MGQSAYGSTNEIQIIERSSGKIFICFWRPGGVFECVPVVVVTEASDWFRGLGGAEEVLFDSTGN